LNSGGWFTEVEFVVGEHLGCGRHLPVGCFRVFDLENEEKGGYEGKGDMMKRTKENEGKGDMMKRKET
jgi:hypothetical protein